MTDLRTPLTRAEVTEIRDEAIERPRLAHGSMKVRDLATTALGLMDRDDERKTIVDDALASSLERAVARVKELEAERDDLERVHRAECETLDKITRERGALLVVLRDAWPTVDSMLCPSVFPTGTPLPHVEMCERIRALLGEPQKERP